MPAWFGISEKVSGYPTRWTRRRLNNVEKSSLTFAVAVVKRVVGSTDQTVGEEVKSSEEELAYLQRLEQELEEELQKVRSRLEKVREEP